MKIFFKPLCFCCSLLLLFGCKTTKIEAPQETYQPAQILPLTSSLNIPIEIDINLLKNLLNENFAGLLYEDNNLDDDNLMIKAWKVRNFEIKFENDAFVYTVPVKLWLKVRWKFEHFGVNISDEKELEGQIALHFKTKFSINKDWQVISQTTTESYEWISKPILKIGTFNMPITVIANRLIESNKKTLNKEIDLAIKQNVLLYENIAEWWNVLQEPFKVSDEYQTWLRFTPLELSSAPIKSYGKYVVLPISLYSTVETFMGKPPIEKKNKLIPPHKAISNIENLTQINMLTQIDYPTIDSLAKISLIGQHFSEGKYFVKVVDLHVYGQNNKMVMGVDLKGSFNGTVYFTGIPYFDSISSSIKLKDFDFDLRTTNVLLKSFKWMYKDTFKRMIASKMVFPMSDLLSEIKDNVQPALNNIELHDNIKASCWLDDIKINEIYLVEQGLTISVQLKGKMKVLVE